MSLNYKDFIEDEDGVVLHPIDEAINKLNIMISSPVLKMRTMESNEDNSISSKDDPNRKELLWEKREEDVVRKWVKEMREQAKKHYKAGKKHKILHEWITIPSILIPVISSGLTPLLQPYPYVSTGLMLTVGVLTGINGFYGFASKKERHLNYEGLYSVLSTEIEKELCKPKKNRIACDVYLESISMKKTQLDLSAPLL